MNSCEEIREFCLECEWPDGDLQRALEAMAHLQSCPACAAAAAEFSRMRSVLKNENTGAPSGGWSAFEKRLLETAVHRAKPARWGWLAIAASVLIAMGGYGVGRWTNRPILATLPPAGTEASGSVQGATGALSQADIDGRVKAFHEISGVFENRAAWLLVGDNTSDMGVSNGAINHETQVYLLRLTMLKSKKVISTADLVILPGQAASLTVPTDESSSLRYRIRTSEDQPTRLMISSQLMTPKGAEVVAALETTLQIKPGQKLSAGNMVTTSGDYELQIAFGRSELGQTGQTPGQ
jgi:hypothetical protein